MFNRRIKRLEKLTTKLTKSIFILENPRKYNNLDVIVVKWFKSYNDVEDFEERNFIVIGYEIKKEKDYYGNLYFKALYTLIDEKNKNETYIFNDNSDIIGLKKNK